MIFYPICWLTKIENWTPLRVEEVKQADGDVVEREEEAMAKQAAELVKSKELTTNVVVHQEDQ